MNRFGSNYYENEHEQYPENIRIGRRLADNAEKPWNDSYRNDGYSLNRHSHPPYRPDHPEQYRRPAGYLPAHNEPYRNEPYRGEYYHNQQMPYDPTDTGPRHHDTSIWTERNFYKDTDYRYRSGHRDQWHHDYDREYDPDWRGDRRQPHDESFLNRVGDGIREGWNNLIHPNRNRDWEQDRRDERHYGPGPQNERNYYRRDSDWKNSGPNHRDEDFIHPTDPRY